MTTHRLASNRATTTFQRTVILPVQAMVGLMIILVIGIAFWVAHELSKDVQTRERALALVAVKERLSLLQKTTDDYAFWDDAYQRTGSSDSEWIDANIALPVAQKYGFQIVGVVDEGGRTEFGRHGDSRFLEPIDTVLAGGFTKLLQDVISHEDHPTASGILLVGDEAALVAVSRIRPFEGRLDPARPNRFLVFTDILNAHQLATIAKAYLLPDLEIADMPVADGDAIELETVDGSKAVSLSWRSADPGRQMLKDLLPPLLLLLAAFTLLTVYVLRQARLAAARLRESEEKALRDPLTGLPNRLSLYAQTEELVLKRQIRFALAYLDLDGFKQINDTFGHTVGDEVLVLSARRMASSVRQQDLLVRLGGDEFALILSDFTTPADIRQIAGRIIGAVEEPITVDGNSMRLGITIGVAFYPGDASTTLDLIRAADAALYRAKRTNKGSVQFALG